MDTISRENNSMLPLGGVIVGVVALLIAGYSAISLSKVKARVDAHDEKISRIDDIAATATHADTAATNLGNSLNKVAKDTQDAFNAVGGQLGEIKADIAKMQEAKKAPAKGAAKGGEPAVAGPGEYIVKTGDVSGAKIARENGVSLADLESVNPGVDWTHLKVGQKLKLPEKKS